METKKRAGIFAPLAAQAWAEDQQKCLGAGMDAWVTKPIDTRQLHDVLHRMLQKTPA